MLKAGNAGDDAPKVTYDNVIGKHAKPSALAGCGKDYYVGEEAMQKRGVLNMTHPMIKGHVRDWDDMEKTRRHVFDNELRVVLGDEREEDEDVAGVCLLCAATNPFQQKAKYFQTLFETFMVRRAMLSVPTVLSLYASGRTTGLVLDAATFSETMPIYEGYAEPAAIQRQNFGTDEVVDYVVDKLRANGVVDLRKSAARMTAKRISEDLGDTFELPDGRLISTECVKDAHEIVHCPAAFGFDGRTKPYYTSLAQQILGTLEKCDEETRPDMARNIVCSGGGTLMGGCGASGRSGMQERLSKDVTAAGYDCKVITPPERMISSWIGGSILCSLSCTLWHTKEAYAEEGPRLAYKMA